MTGKASARELLSHGGSFFRFLYACIGVCLCKIEGFRQGLRALQTGARDIPASTPYNILHGAWAILTGARGIRYL